MGGTAVEEASSRRPLEGRRAIMSTTSMAMPRTLAEQWFPTRTLWRELLLVLGGAALTAALAQFSIRLPFTPVPLTGQTFAVLVTGAALGTRRGLIAELIYVLAGVLGLPVFAGASGGMATLLGPSGGYLLGFIAAAALLGFLAERGWDRGRRVILAMVAGEGVLYVFGVTWLAAYVGGVEKAILLGFVPFIIGDAIKLALAAGVLPTAWKLSGLRH
jgi:biotin transport system substrate-specific component